MSQLRNKTMNESAETTTPAKYDQIQVFNVPESWKLCVCMLFQITGEWSKTRFSKIGKNTQYLQQNVIIGSHIIAKQSGDVRW